MTVGLSMIVKNAVQDLEACLGSVRGWVDEIVVADTGSGDGTPELAERLGARVLRIRWEQDFAQARNQALAGMTSDWVLSLDADERWEGGSGAAARRGWRAQLTSGPDAFQVTIRNYVASLEARLWDRPAQRNDGAWAEGRAYPGFVEHQNVRLFRRHPEIRFVGRVHESVGPRVKAAGLRLGTARGRIHHFGMVRPPAVQAAKNHYDRELGRKKVQEQPADPQAHFELGVVEFDNFGNYGEALRCFERTLRLQPGFVQAWFFGGAALARLGHPQEALAFFQQAEARGARSAALREFMADCAYNLSQYKDAVAGYRAAAADTTPGHAATLLSKRGLAELRAGEAEAGLRHLRRAAAAMPPCADNLDRLANALVACQELAGAVATLRQRVEQFPDQPQGYLRLAAILARQERYADARQCLDDGLRFLPADPQLREAWSDLQHAVGHPATGGLKPAASHADRSA
ncbi:MAG TPA: glycosyltransferase [Terriglobales bacterium]|nr:glycosyltransferase [Terriglobales bacterium]